VNLHARTSVAANATAAFNPVTDPIPVALVATTVTTIATTTVAAALTVIIARVARRNE
jgi:hypothetical protein